MTYLMKTKVNLRSIIAPSFYALHHMVKRHDYTHYWLKGGRGSTKSSFISVEIVRGIMDDPERNAICFRKVGDTLKTSVYEQMIWAIEKLGVLDKWHVGKSEMTLTYLPTGQKIIFRGVDDPKKSKSIKLRRGYFAYAWFEEVDEFKDKTEIDVIIQSILRGGSTFWVFYSFNPPKSLKTWVNNEVTLPRQDKVVHHSTYLGVPPEWLGPQFIVEAETSKKLDFDKYRHEFLGEAVGDGGQFFDGWRESLHVVKPFKIPEGWVRFRCMDWGSAKPYAVYWCAVDYDGNIWVYRELYGYGGKPNVGTKETSKQVAEKICSLEKDEKHLLHYGVLDNACWAKVDTGAPSVAESINKVMAANGCKLFNQSVKGREQMAEEMRLRLTGTLDNEGKQVPGIRFFSNCVHAIRTIPELVHDDRNPEKYDTDGEDHGADAIMYGLMSRPYAASRPKKPDLYSLDGWNDKKDISPWGY